MPAKSIEREEYQRLIECLCAERTSRGISQRDLSKRLSMPVTYIGKVEKGIRRIDVIELAELCSALGIEFENFLRVAVPHAFAGTDSAHKDN